MTVQFIIEGLDNEGEFYTDSNGIGEMFRKLNWRPTWIPSESEPISSNFYPINRGIRAVSKTTG